MATNIKLIRHVEVESVADHSASSFVFRVEGQGKVLVVNQPPDFMAYMQNQLVPASALMEAVLAFHRAQNLALESDPL